jgi:hypothetical protein
MRRTADAPAQVSVPLIVMFALTYSLLRLADAGAVTVRLLKLNNPTTLEVVTAVLVIEKLYKARTIDPVFDKPPPAEPEMLI